jgi:hypothetical protein
LYPRELTDIEKKCLFRILPENKPGYNFYRNKINGMVVLGDGSFGEGNFILGPVEPKPDLSFPIAPVFALGTLYAGNTQIDIIINEETENKIEISLSCDVNEISITGANVKSYSFWVPGLKSPFTDSKVREIIIRPGKFILAVAAEEKKIWLYEFTSGVNHLVPVSNYYNCLMLLRNERNAQKVLNPNLFFDNLGLYNDQELLLAFEKYNQYMRRRLL